jgi:hypothetical protein
MLQTSPHTTAELLQERREGAVRALIRTIGYALAKGIPAETVGRFLFDSYALSGTFARFGTPGSPEAAAAFLTWQHRIRISWCDDVRYEPVDGGYQGISGTLLSGQGSVLGFHGVSRLDMEACLETLWRLAGEALSLSVTYTIGEEQDWLILRAPAGVGSFEPEQPTTPERLAELRRHGLATGLIAGIGFAKQIGDEPEDLGLFFYKVWEGSGHYDRLVSQWGRGNALAYAQNMARGRQLLYLATELKEDLDGYLITSPGWGREMPGTLGCFGVTHDDVTRYYEAGGVAACAKIGLQYADRSDDHFHRVWIRSR